jgi:hypothetical protein
MRADARLIFVEYEHIPLRTIELNGHKHQSHDEFTQ